MRLTPLRSPPTRPRTGSVRIHPRKRKEDPKQRQPDRPLFVEPSPRSAAFWPVREAEHGLGSTRASAARDPLLILFSSPWVQATEICRRPVGLGARGCQPHGPEACLGRVGQDAQPGSCRVRRTAHTSKRLPSLQGRIHGVPRAPNPTGPPTASAFHDQPDTTHEGLRRWLETTRDGGSATDSSVPAAPAASPAWPSSPSRVRRPSHAIPHRARQ